MSEHQEGGASALPRFTNLTTGERTRLTLFKYRYALETAGFTTQEALRILFVAYLWRKKSAPYELRLREH